MENIFSSVVIVVIEKGRQAACKIGENTHVNLHKSIKRLQLTNAQSNKNNQKFHLVLLL